jgi:hypothetical protein
MQLNNCSPARGGTQATFDGTKDGNVKALADKVKQAIDAATRVSLHTQAWMD